MQYNKQQFNKVNDKKIMKKVKKQWVVVSVASLAVLGGFAVSGTLNMNQPSVVAHADENGIKTTLSSDTGKTTPSGDADKTTPSGDAGKTTPSGDAGKTAPSGDADKTTPSGDADKTTPSGDADKTTPSGDADKTTPSGDADKTTPSGDAGKTAPSGDAGKTAPSGDAGKTAPSGDADKTTPSGDADKTTPSGDAGKTAPSGDAGKTAPSGDTKSADQVSAAIEKFFGNSKMLGVSKIADPNVNSENQSEAHQGAIAAWNSIHSDDTQNSDSKILTNTDAYKAGYKGLVDAWAKYNELNNKKGTQATDDYTRANLNGKTPNDPHSVNPNLNSGNNSFTVKNDQDKAQIPNDPNPNVKQQTASELNNKVVASTNNISNDAINNYNNQVTFDKNNNIQINESNQIYYNQGVTDFLKYQGAYDAENGRWNSKGQNDAYTPDPSSQNAYDQSYRGAQDAIKQQFKDDNTFSYNKAGKFDPTNHDDSKNSSYSHGFDDVKNQVNNYGSVYVSNPLQIQNAIIGPSNSAGTTQTSNPNGNLITSGDMYSDQTTKSIKFLNDISYKDTSYYNPSGETVNNVYGGSNKLGLNITVDGQNHSGDFGQVAYRLNNTNDNLTMQNFNALYGINFYGPFHINNTGNINYNNLTYVGPQLAYSTSSTVNVYGNLNVFSVGNYKGPGRTSYITVEGDSGGYTKPVYSASGSDSTNSLTGNSQDNFQVMSFVMQKGSNYYGTSNGSTIMDLQSGGNLTANSNSRMRLVPLNNANTSSESSPDSNAVGLYLEGGNAYINKDATVEIDPQTDGNGKGIAQGIYNKGTINIDGGKLTINDNGPLTKGSEYSNYSGTINVKNNGLLKVNGSNMGNSQRSVNDLLYANGVNISNRGNMEIHTDGSYNNTGTLNLLYLGGSFNIDNPGDQVSLQIDNNGKGNLFTGGNLNGYSVKYAISPNSIGNDVKPYISDPHYQVQVANNGQISYDQLSNGQYVLVNDPKHSATNAKYLSFDATPNAFFDGPINVKNNQGYYVNGKLRLANLPSNVPDGQTKGDNGRVYIQVSADGKNLSNDDIKNSTIKLVHADGSTQDIPYSDISSNSSLSHSGDNNSLKVPNGTTQPLITNQYTDSVRLPEGVKNGDEIQFSYKLDSKPTNNVTVQSTYFVMSQKQVLDSNGSVSSSLENPLKGTDPIDTTPQTGSLITITASSAASDGIADGINDSGQGINTSIDPTKGQNWSTYNNQTSDIQNAYKNSYTDAYNGYSDGKSAYASGSYDPSQYGSNTDAKKQGYAAYGNQVKNGFNDTINGKNDPSNKLNGYTTGSDMATGVQNTLSGQTSKNTSGSNQKKGQDAFNNGWTTSHSGNTDQTQNANNPAYHYGTEMNIGFNDAKTNRTSNQPNQDNYNGNTNAYNTDNSAYQNGQNAFNGMNDALTAKEQGTNDKDSNKNNNDAYNNSYTATQAGLNGDPSHPASTYDNQKQQQTVYGNGLAARDGINDAINGKVDENKYTNAGQSDQKSNYQAAQKAAQDGFNSNGNSTPSNDDQKQLTAYNSGKAAKQGINDYASNGKLSKPSGYSDWSQVQRDSYDNAQKAYQYGLNGNSNSGDLRAKNSLQAYQTGVDAKSGIDAAIKGTSANDFNNQTSNPSQAAKDAFKATQDGINSNPGTPASDPTDKQQNNAYMMGQAVKAGISDKKANADGINQNSFSNDWNDQQKQAYKDAQTAYSDGAGDNQTKNQNVDAAQGYAYQQGQEYQAVQTGTKDAAAGKDKLSNDVAKSQKGWSDPQAQAYSDAYDAFKDGYKNTNNTPDADKNQSGSYAQGQAARAGALDAANGNTNDGYNKGNNWSQQQKQAYVDAKKAYNVGNDNNTSYTNPDGAPGVSNKPQDIQTLAYQDGLVATAVKSGQDTAKNNQPLSTNDSKFTDPDQKQAYQDAYKAYNDGFNGTTSTPADSNQNNSYQLGKAARAGITDSQDSKANSDTDSAYNNNKPKNGWTTGQIDAYNDAKDSYSKGFNNPNGSADKGNDPLSYAVGQASGKGISDAQSNPSNTADKQGYSDPNSAEAKAYNTAKGNFDAGMSNGDKLPNSDTNADKNSDAYKSGQAAQTGTNDAIAGNESNKGNYQNNPEKTAYANSQAAYKAGLAGNTTTGDATLNQPANAAGDAARKGIVDSTSNDGKKASDYGYKDGSNEANAYNNAQKAYNAGLAGNTTTGDATLNQPANAAGDAARKGIVDSTSNDGKKASDYGYKDGSNEANAYNNAQKAYNAGLAGNTTTGDATLNQPANAAGDAARKGIVDSTSNDGKKASDYGYKDGSNEANAYNNAQKAYNAGLAGNTTTGDATLNQPANAAGDAARKGIVDSTSNDGKKASDYGYKDGSNEANAYNNAQKAYNAGLAGNTTTGDATLNQPANAAGDAARKGIVDSTSNDGKKASDYGYKDGSNEANAYNNAQKAYNAGLAGNTTTGDATLNQPANAAGDAARKGIVDSTSNDGKKASDYGYKDGSNEANAYNNAQKAYNAGLAGNTTTGDATLNQPANAAGDAARKGIVDSTSNDGKKASDYGYKDGSNEANAYNNAQKAYNAGLAGNTTTGDATLNQPANAAGDAARKGIVDSTSNDGKKASDYGYKDGSNEANAYNNAQKAYNAGLAGNTTTGDATLNQPANAAGDAARKGIVDSTSNDGKKASDYGYKDGSNEANAYNNAQKAYNAGLAGNTTTGDATLNQPANAAGDAARKGIVDSTSNDGKKASDYGYKDGSNEANAYNNAQKAYNAGLAGNTTTGDATLNQPANAAGDAARKGIVDSTSNDGKKASDYGYKDGSNEANAYNNAQKAYNAGLAGNTTTGDATLNQPANAAGDAARKGIVDSTSNDGKKASDYGYKDGSNEANAYNNAQKAYNAGLAGNTTTGDATLNQPANAAGDAARKGIVDSTSNDGKKASDYGYKDGSNEANAYNNAQKAYNAGLNGQPSTDKNYQLNPTAGQAGKSAQAGIADGIGGKPSDPKYQNDSSYQQAYKDSQLARQGANDAINGQTEDSKNKDNPSYNDAYQAVKNNTDLNGKDATLPNVITQAAQSAQQGRKDAQSGKNLADPKNKNDSNNPYYNGSWTPTQKQNYDNAQVAYNAGNNGDTTSANAKKNYDANQSGYNNYLANQPKPQPTPQNNNDSGEGVKAGRKAFMGGIPLDINNINFAGRSQSYKDAFTKSYNQSQDGFKAGFNGIGRESSDPSYQAGYKAAKDYQKGVNDATRGKKPTNNSSDAYKIGYEAYNSGINGKKSKAIDVDKLAPAYRKAYDQAYQVGHNKYVVFTNKGERAGRKNAVGNNRIPRNLKHQSKAYKDAYMKAFNEEVKRNLPRYVYNLRKIYSHDKAALTRKTRVQKYSKTPRYARHAFKVLGYKITASGQVVYKVKGLGWISASDKSVDNLYYRRADTKKPIQRVRVIKPEGTYIYNSKHFNDETMVRKVRAGEKIRVLRIEKLGHITRFYIGHGQYISSNKTIVDHIR